MAKYRALEADLVSSERWKNSKDALIAQTQLLKVVSKPDVLIQEMKQALESRLQDVSDYLEKSDNRNVVLRNPKGKRSWRLPTGSKSQMVNNPFFQQLPTTAVADVLRMVYRDTGFIECFKHVLGTQSKNRCLSAKLPIFAHYNIQEDVVHARVIGANEHESHYIFDLLFNNTSDIKPELLSTDTHGVNHVNFALLELFGYSFAPRYAQVGRIINEMLAVTQDNDGKINLSLKAPIKTHCIARHWDSIQRIIVSLRERKTTQAFLVRKLSGYKKNHPLLEALTEYNRLVKACHQRREWRSVQRQL